MPNSKRYIIIDTHTNSQIGKTYSSKLRAKKRAELLDIGWGGNRYIYKEITDENNEMKIGFKQFLLERFGVTGHELDKTSNVKVDIVDIIRQHVNSSEVLFSNLRVGKEKEYFYYYFNKLLQKYNIDGIKHKEMFKNGFSIYFHAPNLKPGHFLKLSTVLPDENTARQVYDDLVSKFNVRV